MSPRQPPPVDPLDFVEDLLATDELEALAKKPIAELDAAIRQRGQDPALADQIFERVLAERRTAVPPPGVNEVPVAAEVSGATEEPSLSKTVDFSRARAKRRGSVGWLLVAALGIGVVDLALTHKQAIVAHFEPAAPQVPSPPSGPSPPPARAPGPQAIAVDLRAGALESCARHLFDACAAALDRARELDPEGEKAADVQEARAAIAAGGDPGAFEGAKPGDRPPPSPRKGGPSPKNGAAPPQ